jgi:hypothetical protein
MDIRYDFRNGVYAVPDSACIEIVIEFTIDDRRAYA